MSDHPETTGGRWLKRGDTFDPECWRTTHRLRVGAGIIASLGIKAEYPQHDEKCILSPAQSFRRGGADRYRFNCTCGVGHDPQPTWPEWVTGRVFDLAYQLANETQTKRGEFERRNAAAAKRERSVTPA